MRKQRKLLPFLYIITLTSFCFLSAQEEIADVAGSYSHPIHSSSPTPATIGGAYGSRAISGSDFSIQSRPSSIGARYSAPITPYGSVSEAGSWSSVTPTDIGRSRGGVYNYNGYNTNRNFETSPTYQVNRPLLPPTPLAVPTVPTVPTVAPYGAPYTTQAGGGYPAITSSGYEAVNASAVMTEAELRPLLSPQGWALYTNLTPEGKALALQLASQANFTNKDLAVKEAYLRTEEKRIYSN